MTRLSPPSLVLICLALGASGCDSQAHKFAVIDHVVTGKVSVSGKPGAGVKLVFIPVEGGSNAGQTYNLVVGDDGTYTVNSLVASGGPAAGDYVICASYPQGPGNDLFKGEFNDPKTTPFKATITPETHELPIIKIEKYTLPAKVRKTAAKQAEGD